jgi:diguanylate cyclase (GGDEF)-like protein/PAS domain S-box-containing protein
MDLPTAKSGSAPTLRILIAEDVAADAELEVRELKRSGLRFTHRVVATEKDFIEGLRQFGPDVILSDFSMSGFDGMAALSIARELAPEIPFIFVSGTLGEEYAIRALKNGATDYVVKANLARLPVAVERGVADAKLLMERRRAEVALEIARERLQEREAGLRRAQHMAKLAHMITGPDGTVENWSESLAELIAARPPASTRGWLELIHPDDRAVFRDKALQASSSLLQTQVEYRLKRAQGDWIQVRQAMEPLDEKRDDGKPRWFNTIQDITEQKAAEQRIHRLNRVYAVLSGVNSLIVRAAGREELFKEACRIAIEAGEFRMAWIGVVDADAMVVRPAASAGPIGDFFDRVPLAIAEANQGGQGLAGRAVRTKRPVVSNDVQPDPQTVMKKECAERGINALAVIPLILDGRVIGVFCLYAADIGFFDDEEMRLLVELAGDIAFALDHIEKSEKLNYLSYYDPVTGLANRALFVERVSAKILAASKTEGKLGLWIVDLERFKAINDALGRSAGDELLRQIGHRIQTAAGDAGRVARIAADHFAIVSNDIRTEDDAGRFAEKQLVECFRAPYKIADHEIRISARIGVATFPADARDPESLISAAEAALNKAKASGERYLFYTRAMTQRVAEHLLLENKLRQALENDEYVLHYQPKIDLRERRIVGLEALIRWRSPDLGLVPPIRFISLLEETGLILEVGSWALRRAALDHRGWTEKRLKAPRVAVNVSAIQLQQRDFVGIVEKAIIEGVRPTAVDLEVTESLIMQDIAANIVKLKAAKALGLNVAIDDFGTGYSSLAYLAKLPVETVKIDRAFVNDILGDHYSATLIQSIIGLAHALQLTVVAEGVETEAQAQKLLELGCDQMQGYLFSKPLPADQLEVLLASG